MQMMRGRVDIFWVETMYKMGETYMGMIVVIVVFIFMGTVVVFIFMIIVVVVKIFMRAVVVFIFMIIVVVMFIFMVVVFVMVLWMRKVNVNELASL